MLVVDVVDGVSERFFLLLSRGWLAGSSRKPFEYNVFDSPAVTSLQHNNPENQPNRASRMDGVVVIHLTSTQQAATLHICIPVETLDNDVGRLRPWHEAVNSKGFEAYTYIEQ